MKKKKKKALILHNKNLFFNLISFLVNALNAIVNINHID